VSKGGNSFASVLRFVFFNITPIIIEIIFVVATIGILYDYQILLINVGSILAYGIVTVMITECRSKYFKTMQNKDARNVQVATDSLLNFETVKYFNAEDHEQHRFFKSLKDYKKSNIQVA
jgi:ABC-type transport system involved in Fe-S cluster assembly fused permease/ATPase subunit